MVYHSGAGRDSWQHIVGVWNESQGEVRENTGKLFLKRAFPVLRSAKISATSERAKISVYNKFKDNLPFSGTLLCSEMKLPGS